MNQEQLMALAQALGIDPNAENLAEQLLAALDSAREMLTSSANMSEDDPAYANVIAMRSALVGEDADNEAALARLEQIKSATEAYFAEAAAKAEQEDKQVEVNLEGLGQVAAGVGQAAKTVRTINIPYTVGSKYEANGVKASKAFGAVNVNKGAKEPGLYDLVLGLAHGDSKAIKSATKAQGVSENVLGGYIAREEISQDFLEPLYAKEVVMDAGAEMVPMDGIETLTIRKDKGGSTAYWAGEHLAVSQADNNFGVVRLSLKELVVEKRISKRLLRATPGAEQRFINDMRRQAALKMDLSFLTGTGTTPSGSTGAEPQGLLQILTDQALTQITTIATNGRKAQIADIGNAVKNILSRDIDESETWGAIMHPIVSEDFSDLTDTTGQPLMRENWAGRPRPMIRGMNRYATTQVPATVTTGTSSTTSYIFIGDWQYAFVGMGQDIEVAVDESVYRRQRDVLIQLVLMVDFAVAYTEAFEIVAGVETS